MRQPIILFLMSLAISFGVLLTEGRMADAFFPQDRLQTFKGVSHYTMGQYFEMIGLQERALMEYQQAARYDEGSFVIRLKLGAIYARLGLLEEAERELITATKLKPNDVTAHYFLAVIYYSMEKYDLAAREYELWLQSFAADNPENIKIYSYLGQFYYSQNEYQKAIQQFEKILEFESSNPDVMHVLSSLYLEVEETDKAINLLEAAIEIDPEHSGSLNTLGYIFTERNVNLDFALELIQKAVELDPENGAYLDSLGWNYYKQGDLDNALKYLKKADQFINDPIVYDHIGDVLFKMNRIDEAIQFWQKSIQLHPSEEVKRKISENKENQASF